MRSILRLRCGIKIIPCNIWSRSARIYARRIRLPPLLRIVAEAEIAKNPLLIAPVLLHFDP